MVRKSDLPQGKLFIEQIGEGVVDGIEERAVGADDVAIEVQENDADQIGIQYSAQSSFKIALEEFGQSTAVGVSLFHTRACRFPYRRISL
jgi:hypothetical protein